MATDGERLAVVETLTQTQADDIKEILCEVKNVAAFIYEIKPMLDQLTSADLPDRMTRVETKHKIYTGIAIFLATVAGLKEYIAKWIFG